MTPAWFQRALRYLRPRWTAQHGIETPTHRNPTDHQAHLLADGRMCCPTHEDQFRPWFSLTIRPGREDQSHLSAQERHYIDRRLGHHPSPMPRHMQP
jgi:hypothetical protein